MSLNISSDLVPQVVNNYNAYTGDDKMIGLADEVTLPKIKNKTTTVNGMGIGGDVSPLQCLPRNPAEQSELSTGKEHGGGISHGLPGVCRPPEKVSL